MSEYVGYHERAIPYEDQRGRSRYQPAVTILHPTEGVKTLLRWWSNGYPSYTYWAKEWRADWDEPDLMGKRSALRTARRKIKKLRSQFRKVD